MNAKKCDRCGEFYIPDYNSAMCNAISKYRQLRHDCDGNKNYDLCYKCMKSFERWLSNED